MIKKVKNTLFSLILISVFFFIGCESHNSNQDFISAKFTSNNQNDLIELKLEVADTSPKRSLGLMYRNELKPNHGMIFIFPKSELQSFWMKNTQIPLDIIFLDESFKVVAIQENAIPYSTSPRDSKGKLARYVVELIGGSCDKFGITEGAVLTINEGQILPDPQ